MINTDVDYQNNFKGIDICAFISTGWSRSVSRFSIILSSESLHSMVERKKVVQGRRVDRRGVLGSLLDYY